MVKNIFLDFNGTIVDDLKLSFSIQQNMIEIFNLKKVTLEEYRSNFRFPVSEYYDYIGCPKEKFKEASVYFFDQYNKRMPKETKLVKGMLPLLKKLKKEGRKIYILTACEKELLYKQIAEYKIDKYIDGIACLEDMNAKGKLEIGKKFVEENNIDTSSSCLIGDTVHDYDVAKALNMKSILYTKGHNTIELLEKCDGAILVDSLNKVYKNL